MAQKIIPNLWFNGNAEEAANFYAATFPKAAIGAVTRYPNSVEEGLADFQLDLAGKVLTIDFTIDTMQFSCINAGPEFTPNASISFMVNFDPSQDEHAAQHLDELWNALIEGGEALMPLDEYPFSQRYGWVKDKYGLTWQLILTNPNGDPRPFIVPSFLFSGSNTNRAEEAMQFYTSVFADSQQGTVARYTEDTGPAKTGSLMFADFTLAGQWFAIMDSGTERDAPFSEAISLAVMCADQTEIDSLWDKLSTVPEAEQCGWCKDQFGVSWQIVPQNMGELMARPDAFKHMMAMHKLVIADF